MLDFDALRQSADRSATVTKGGRSYSFRKLGAITIDEKLDLQKRVKKMNVAELLAILAEMDGCEVTAGDITAAFEDWELQLIAEEVNKPVSLGES